MRSVSQVLLVGELQLLERGGEDVLDDHHAPFGRHDDPLRRQRAVANLGHRLVEDRDRGDELTQHADRGVEFDRNQVSLVGLENSG